MRIVFMGTPDFAEASLAALVEDGQTVCAVYTQPDRPKGRGMQMSISPVKAFAMEKGIPVFQPEKLRDPEEIEKLRSLKPDLIVTAAYGKLIPDEMLAVPGFGAINLHGSILPRYRGAAPIQWAVLNGDQTTGVTTFYLTHQMDAGDIIFTEETAIGEYETSGELFERLKILGASLLVRTVHAIANGTAPRIPQNHEEATSVGRLDKSMSPIQWNKTPREIIKWIYGMQPWPVATMRLGGETCKVFGAVYTDHHTQEQPGTVVSADKNGIEVACASGGTVLITEVQKPGKRRMTAAEYLRGNPLKNLPLAPEAPESEL